MLTKTTKTTKNTLFTIKTEDHFSKVAFLPKIVYLGVCKSVISCLEGVFYGFYGYFMGILGDLLGKINKKVLKTRKPNT